MLYDPRRRLQISLTIRSCCTPAPRSGLQNPENLLLILKIQTAQERQKHLDEGIFKQDFDIRFRDKPLHPNDSLTSRS